MSLGKTRPTALAITITEGTIAMATPSLAQLNPRQQSAAVILARQAARNAVKRQIQRRGRVKLSMVPYGEITRLADAYLREHHELYAQSALSPIVQNLKDKH